MRKRYLFITLIFNIEKNLYPVSFNSKKLEKA